MQKLTPQNIQFIENYLENSDIIYADIRMEMTDHVASALEDKINQGDRRDFYYIFKDYMVENKAKLLNSFKAQKKKTFNKFVQRLLKSLISLKSIVLSIVFFIVFYVNWDWLKPYIQNRNYWSLGWLSTLILLVVFWAIIRQKTGKNRFMAIEQMFLAMFLLTYSLHIFLNLQIIVQKLNETYHSLFAIGILIFALMIWVNFILIVKKYVKLYEAKYSLVK